MLLLTSPSPLLTGIFISSLLSVAYPTHCVLAYFISFFFLIFSCFVSFMSTIPRAVGFHGKNMFSTAVRVHERIVMNCCMRYNIV
ncbi:hypothetical protein C8R45DRAFT_959796 [Mycena sanguinolenta]|nr:hypothetical protein C8R45DRAFT_959796 [Mycena sanguinolenta]